MSDPDRVPGGVSDRVSDRVVAGLLESAREFLESGRTPAVPRDAATVALVRDGASGLEVYLLRRVAAMAFAPGAYVYPGGSVDADDRDAEVRWAGAPAAAWAATFGTDEPTALALVCAAVRETFEESGVLLAGPSPDEVLPDVSGAEWEAERAALEARQQSLSQLLERRDLVLRADLLRPLAHWITPEAEPKRFDTRFFLAAMPAGQLARDVGGEADDRVWVRPADALDSGLTLMPPTRSVLVDLARFDDVASALAADRPIQPVLPKFVMVEGEVRFLRPEDPGYPW
jgi:8-oxo-dGTP pyrophosphatase MutT (NUDIX family)